MRSDRDKRAGTKEERAARAEIAFVNGSYLEALDGFLSVNFSGAYKDRIVAVLSLTGNERAARIFAGESVRPQESGQIRADFRANLSALLRAHPYLVEDGSSALLAEMDPACAFAERIPASVDGVRAVLRSRHLVVDGSLNDDISHGGAYHATLVLDSIGTGRCLLSAIAFTERIKLRSGFDVPVIVIEDDIPGFVSFLTELTYRDALSCTRVHYIVGPEWEGKLRQFIVDNPGLPPVPVHSNRIEGVAEATDRQFSAAFGGKLACQFSVKPPVAISDCRILSVIPQFTSVLRFVMTPLIRELIAQGAQVAVLTEQGSADRVTSKHIFEEANRFHPHAILTAHSPVEIAVSGVRSYFWSQDPNPFLRAPQNVSTTAYVFANCFAPTLAALGYRVGMLPAAVDEHEFKHEKHDVIAESDYEYDISFVSHFDYVLYPEFGEELTGKTLESLVDHFDKGHFIEYGDASFLVDVGLTPDDPSADRFLFYAHTDLSRIALRIIWLRRIIAYLRRDRRGLRCALFGRGWSEYPEFTPYDHGPINDRARLAEVYRQSKINIHINPHTNMHQRFLEASLMGGFALMPTLPDDSREFGMGSWFVKGFEYDSFADVSEMSAKLDHYLANPEARHAMVAAATKKILANHTYRSRAQTILSDIFRDTQQ